MGLALNLNRDDDLALYRQIAEQLRTQIQQGRLPAGTRLPTLRQLSAELSVTRLTVQNAYSELQADGLIESIVGRGTFVSQEAQPEKLPRPVAEAFNPESMLGDLHHLMHVRVVRKLVSNQPDSSLFPVDEFWASLMAIRPDGQELLGYGTPMGDSQLRVELVKMISEIGIASSPSQLLITNGAMHGIDLAARGLARAGDVALVEEPTFLVLHNLLKEQGIRLIAVPMDENGPKLDVLQRILLRERPRFYYTMPNFHNPTGICFSAEHRRAILDLSIKHNFTIVEDDAYSLLAYDAPPPPSLAALSIRPNVLYISSLSKMLLPGLRIGFMSGDAELIEQIMRIRQLSDLSGSPLMQRAAAHFLKSGGFKRHLKRVIPVYRQKRDTLVLALQRYMPPFVSWTHPVGGFCLWLTMPRLFESGELYRIALEQGIAFAAGEAFLSRPTEQEHLRLSYGNQSREGIYAGVEQLAQIIRHRAR
ncbi:MAG: PLP-dependent aminotransferase family protein [Candidatus Promineifilaceae bacterium]